MLSMIGHRHFFTPYETDLQIHCLTHRSTVDAPQAASSCARICSKSRSSQRSRSRSHAVGNDRYLRTGVVHEVVFARQHSRLRDVRTMFAARPPADEELGVRGLGCAIGSTVCPRMGFVSGSCWTACSRMPTREERGGIFAEILAGNSGGPFRLYRTMIRNFRRPLFGRRRHPMPVSPDYRVGLCAARLAKRVKLSYLENPGSPGDRRFPGVMKNCLLPPLGPLFAKCRG